ncbi:MAG TPA: FxLYD domain-containing protein [bacterium]|nr:FxLYD domain-containing protein [bacterium]
MKRSLAFALAVAAVIIGLPGARADLPGRIPVVMLDQPSVPVRLTEIQSVVSLLPADHTLATVWFVRGVMTNVTRKRIVATETTWTLVNADGEIVGAIRTLYENPIAPGERRQTVIGVLTDLLHKRGERVIGLVRRVRFEDGSFWTAPPAELAKVPR